MEEDEEEEEGEAAEGKEDEGDKNSEAEMMDAEAVCSHSERAAAAQLNGKTSNQRRKVR